MQLYGVHSLKIQRMYLKARCTFLRKLLNLADNFVIRNKILLPVQYSM